MMGVCMGQIRVLILISNMNIAGVQALVMNYFRHMDRGYVSFDFLVNHQGEDDYEEEIKELGGEIYRMSSLKLNRISEYKRELRNFLKTHPQYQVIHSYLEEGSYYALRIAKELKIPLRICQANSYPSHFDYTLPLKCYFKIKQRKYFTHCLATSREASDWLFGVKRRRGVMNIKKAIDTNKFRKSKEWREETKDLLGIGENFVIGHIGRFDRKKTYDKLLAVFSEIYRRNQSARLLIVGGGKSKRELGNREQIQRRVRELRLANAVRFVGERLDVDKLMQAMDVLVIPTTNYNCSLTLIEAQSVGLRCVVSDHISPRYNLTGNVDFLPLEMKHSVWADKIIEKIKEPQIDRAYLVADKGYDIKEAAKVLQNFYVKELEQAVGGKTGDKDEDI